MQLYRHRQNGTLILWTVGGAAALAATLLAVTVARQPVAAAVTGIALLVLLACLVLFGSLTVEVTEDRLRVSFGPGAIRRTIPLRDVRGARTVANPWWYGWGLRLTPHGWLYNVSGSEAVEVDLAGGRKVRIGTDEPDRLLAAIRRAAGPAG